MDEEEINLWFEDKKEELLKDYLKKMDSLLIEDDSEDKKKAQPKFSLEQIKNLMMAYEKKFVADSTIVRAKYDSMIQKVRKKEKNKQAGIDNKEKFKNNISPLIEPIKVSWNYLASLNSRLKKRLKILLSVYLFPSIKRGFQKISLVLGNFIRPIRFYYRLKIWPTLHFLNTPNRKLKIKLLKLKDVVKERIKKWISFVKDKSIKIIKKTLEIAKKIFGLIGHALKSVMDAVAAFIKNIKEFAKKLYLYIRSRLPHKSED